MHRIMGGMHGNLAQLIMLGHAYRRRGDFPFGLRQADRLQHLYIIGQTGTGKTTLIANLIAQDIRAGQGLCLIDPHGDLADKLSQHIRPPNIYWDVADPLSPYGYNPLTRTSPALQPLVCSGLIDALKKQWKDAWGVRMEHLLRYAILALLDQPKTDLRDILRLFIDKPFRTGVIDRVADPQVRHFWTREFPAMNYKTAIDGVAPIANKLGAFLAHPIVRTAVCEPREPLRLRGLMDDSRILIINLAKGRIGSDMANVLGGLLVASIMNAALSRHDTPENDRVPFMLYLDEFASFTTLAIANMLSETRKYGLGLILAHQHIAQAEPDVYEAIIGNVGSVLAFRVGAFDAPTIAKQFVTVDQADLINLRNYHAFAQISVDGTKTKTFSMTSWGPDRYESDHCAA